MKFICGRNFGRNSRRRDSATDFELYKIFYTGNATIIAKKFFGGIIVDDKAIAAQKLAEAKKNYDMGKYLNAVAYCEQALKFMRFHSDGVKEIYFLLGLAHSELGTTYSEWDLNDSILACKYFDKVIAMDENFSEAYLQRGLAILRWGNNYRLALADFDKVLELEPDNELASEGRDVCLKFLAAEAACE